MMIYTILFALGTACQNTQRKRAPKETDREFGQLANATTQANALWLTLNKLVVQGETDAVIELCYKLYMHSDIDACIATASAGAGALNTNIWSNWSLWTSCSKSCHSGVETRERKCLHNHSSVPCEGAHAESRPCNTFPCPYWSAWMSWSNECSATCGGIRLRFRRCEEGRIGSDGCKSSQNGVGAVDASVCGESCVV